MWTHSYVNSFELIHMCTHSYVNSFICELIDMWTDSYVNWFEVKDTHEGLTVHHSRPWGRIRIEIPSNVPCSRRTAPPLCTFVHLCDVTHSYMRQGLTDVWHGSNRYIFRQTLRVISHIYGSNRYSDKRCVSCHTSVAWVDIFSVKRCVSYHTSMARIDIPTNFLCHVTRLWRESICIQSNVACHITHLWVLSHIRMSHVTQVNDFSNKFQKFWGLVDVWHDDSNQYPAIWMKCRTYEWVMSHTRRSHVTPMIESCHTHVSFIWLDIDLNRHILRVTVAPRPATELCHTYEWNMPHVWMSHVAYTNESCHSYDWVMSHVWSVMSHIWMSHVTRSNESCRMHKWVMSHKWMTHVARVMNHVTNMNESCHSYEWVMSQRSHVTHMNESCDESCRTYEWVILDRHSVINGPWNRCTRYARMSHATPVDLQAWRDSIIDVTGLMEVGHTSGTMRHIYRSLLHVSFHTYMSLLSLLQVSFRMYTSFSASGTIRVNVRRKRNELIDVCHTSMSPKWAQLYDSFVGIIYIFRRTFSRIVPDATRDVYMRKETCKRDL